MAAKKEEVKKDKPAEELALNVKVDAVGKAAKAYLKAIDAENKAKTKKDAACATLVEQMREHKRRTINVDGRSISLRHVEAQDQIKVKKASDK